MARRNKKKHKTVRKSPAAAPKKRHTVRWMPDVTQSGELVLRRTQPTTQPQSGDMNYPFSQGLTFVARRWRNLMNDELRAAGQSQARWGTLYWITVFGDTVNQTELAGRIGVEQQTLGRVLRDLESAGVITRVSGDAQDQCHSGSGACTVVERDIAPRTRSLHGRLRQNTLQYRSPLNRGASRRRPRRSVLHCSILPVHAIACLPTFPAAPTGH
jgi:DNA-binding HxlR family transcriptional regulator